MTDYGQFRETYNTAGCVVVRTYLPVERLKEIRAEARSVFDIQIRRNGISDGQYGDEAEFERALFQLFRVNYNAFVGAARLCQHTFAMHRLAVSEEVLALVRGLGVQAPTICVKPIIYFNSKNLAKIEGHYKTPAHQDWRSMQGSLNSLIVWIPFVDVDFSLGALEIVPGSHELGLLETEKDEWFRHVVGVKEADFVSLDVKQGDVVCFSSFLVHRSGNNVTERIRWSMHFRYNDAVEYTWVERGFPHPYAVYRPEQDLLHPGFPKPEQLAEVFAWRRDGN